jgi:octaprenyl-diphosphate synthase
LKTAARLADLAQQSGDAAAESEELDLSPVLEGVRRYRGVEDTVRRAEEHIERAVESIAPFPDGPAKQALLESAGYAVARGR